MPQTTAQYELKSIAVWPVIRFVGVVSLFLTVFLTMMVITVLLTVMGGLSILWQELGVMPADQPDFAAGLPGLLALGLFSAVAQTIVLIVIAAILILLYNLSAGFLGGVRLRLQALPDATPVPVSQEPVPQPSPASPESSGASTSITHE